MNKTFMLVIFLLMAMMTIGHLVFKRDVIPFSAAALVVCYIEGRFGSLLKVG